MSAKANVTNSNQFTVTARELDFVTRFGQNWDILAKMMGVVRPIRKTPGTQLVSYVASCDGTLNGGTVTEGDEIPFTKYKVVESAKADIAIKKYAKSVTIESVSKYGAAVAVEKTDEAFLSQLQNVVISDFFTNITDDTVVGRMKGNMKTWQKALAMAKGAVVDQFADMDRTATEVVGFANIMDAYEYVGDAGITIQSAFGIQYVENFLGYKTLFLLPAKCIPAKTVVALPVENIDLYYTDPSDSDYAKLGLNYTVQGETNLIGFHVDGDYSRATGDCFAIMGLKLWAEYENGIAIVKVSSATESITKVAGA